MQLQRMAGNAAVTRLVEGHHHRPVRRPVQREESGPTERSGAGVQGIGEALPAIELKKKVFSRKGPERDFGWVTAGFSMSVEMKGKVQHGEPANKVSMSGDDAEVSRKVDTALGEAELKLSGGKDEPGKLAIEFGGKTLGWEASARANWEEPFSLSAKQKFPSGALTFGGWSVDGEVEVTYEIFVRPSARVLASAARTALRVGGEVAGSTAFAVIGTTVIWWGWVAGGLMAAGHASREGKDEAVGFAFSRGLASTLGALSETQVRDVDRSLYSIPWQGLVVEASRAYHEPGASVAAAKAMDNIRLAGCARAVQAVGARHFTERARSEWADRQRRELGTDPRTRELVYLGDLMEQVRSHKLPQELRVPHLE